MMGDEDMGDKFALRYEPPPERRGRPKGGVSPDVRRFNEALWRIVRGKYDVGGVSHELAVVTGLSIETIRARVDSIEYEPSPLEGGTGLTADDLKYLGKLCKSHKSPEVREFYRNISGGKRRDPDREDARVGRQRIDGRLIALAIDPASN